VDQTLHLSAKKKASVSNLAGGFRFYTGVFIENKYQVALQPHAHFDLVASLVFAPGGDLLPCLGVTGATEWIEEGEDDAPQQQDRRYWPH
jgi:hypothetical protein